MDRYDNLKVVYIDHHNPDLVLIDRGGKELNRIDLTRLSSTASMHKLMVLLGLDEICMDTNEQCGSWASNGECTKNPQFMNDSCRRSCGLCSQGASISDELPCRDTGSREDCEYWSTMGECQANEAFMRGQCQRSCRFCERENLTETKDEL